MGGKLFISKDMKGLQKASLSAECLVSELQEALGMAKPTESLVILPMIERAVDLHKGINALMAAITEQAGSPDNDRPN